MERRGARHHGQKKKIAKLSSDVAGSHCELRRRRQKAPWTDVDKLFGCALQIFHKNRQAGHRIPPLGFVNLGPTLSPPFVNGAFILDSLRDSVYNSA